MSSGQASVGERDYERVYAHLLRFFPELVRRLGDAPERLLERFAPAPNLTYRAWVNLLEQAASELHCPDFGLRLARLQAGGHVLGPMGTVMKHSNTFGEAIAYVASHFHAHSLAAGLRLERDARAGTLFVSHEILLEDLPNRRQALEQALCFGWIDGLVKSIDADTYMQRWSPRKKGSYWSAVNIRKANALIASGAMCPAGQAAFESRVSGTGRYTNEHPAATFDAGMLRQFKRERKAWEWFEAQPARFRKVATHWVTSAKRPETRASRLANLIDAASRGERPRAFVPTWLQRSGPELRQPRKERLTPSNKKTTHAANGL